MEMFSSMAADFHAERAYHCTAARNCKNDNNSNNNKTKRKKQDSVEMLLNSAFFFFIYFFFLFFFAFEDKTRSLKTLTTMGFSHTHEKTKQHKLTAEMKRYSSIWRKHG